MTLSQESRSEVGAGDAVAGADRQGGPAPSIAQATHRESLPKRDPTRRTGQFATGQGDLSTRRLDALGGENG